MLGICHHYECEEVIPRVDCVTLNFATVVSQAFASVPTKCRGDLIWEQHHKAGTWNNRDTVTEV